MFRLERRYTETEREIFSALKDNWLTLGELVAATGRNTDYIDRTVRALIIEGYISTGLSAPGEKDHIQTITGEPAGAMCRVYTLRNLTTKASHDWVIDNDGWITSVFIGTLPDHPMPGPDAWGEIPDWLRHFRGKNWFTLGDERMVAGLVKIQEIRAKRQ